jgi:hypothetical protein
LEHGWKGCRDCRLCLYPSASFPLSLGTYPRGKPKLAQHRFARQHDKDVQAIARVEGDGNNNKLTQDGVGWGRVQPSNLESRRRQAGYWPCLFAVCISSRYAALQLWPLGTGRAWGACQSDSKKDKEAWRTRREMVTKM